jgi:immune inhibitor A
VVEAVNAINSDSPGFSWQTYDGDGDGIVDNFTVIHAGMGQEGGGGLQGDDAIWSHASLINYPTGYKACSQGSTGCPDRDIFVREYSMDPENLDVGVISEEFGHAAFGLPDIYTTDAQGSPANWAIMEAGSWNGILGGMQPAPFPLWVRLLVGWAKPSEMSYTAKPSLNVVGQLSQRPKGTQYGLKINMPDQVVDVENPLGTGIAWWSDVADLADNTLTHTFNLTGTTAPVFSFNSYWSIEQDYDYGYVEVSTDGAAWTPLRDTTGKMVADVNGSYGLTGEDTAPLSFDLSAYAGQQIQLRLRYVSDIGVQWRGWWADDFALKDGAAILFTDDVEGATTWVTDTWTTVPLTRTYPMFYLVEWRNLSGFDQGLKYPYATVYNDDTQWQVDRTPYTVPGMLVWLRNARYSFDYTLYDSLYDPPSYGPKHALLVVDSHPYPLQWNALAASTAPARLTSRAQPSNATFTLQPTTPFTVRLGYNPITGVYQDTPVETKTFGPQPAVSQFHDSLGYYPGLWYRPANDGLYFWDAQSSLAVPAKGNYTTKITDISNQPFTDLYGIDLGDTVLGTGNPGDSAVQYGLNLAVVGKAKDGSWGAIEMWNSPSLTKLDMRVNKEETSAGGLLHYMITLKNLSPIPQKVVLDAPIPENTTFAGGMFYNRHTKSIHLETTLIPNFTFVVGYKVRVNSGTPVDTVITGAAQVKDDGLGAAAIATTTIVDKSSSYWKDAPDEGEGSTIFLPSIIN